MLILLSITGKQQRTFCEYHDWVRLKLAKNCYLYQVFLKSS